MTRRLAAAVLPLLVAAGAFGAEVTGWIEGRITAAARHDAPPAPKGDAAYQKRSLQKAVRFDYDHPGKFVVFMAALDRPPRPATDASTRASLSSKRGKLSLAPDLFWVPLGGKIILQNTDQVHRNLYAVSTSAKNMNVQIAPKGSREVQCLRSGPVHFRSLDDHSLAATGYITPSSLAMLTDDEGRYRLEAEPGRYEVNIWHPRLPPLQVIVQIEPGRTIRSDFTTGVDHMKH